MGEFHIRRVVESDVAIGEGLIQAAFLEEFKSIYGFAPNSEVIKSVYDRSWMQGLVLVDQDDQIMGAVGGTILSQYPDTMVQTVWYLKKEVRRYAFELMTAFENLSKALGAVRLSVTCMGSDRIPAKIRKFQASGFKLTEMKFYKELKNG